MLYFFRFIVTDIKGNISIEAPKYDTIMNNKWTSRKIIAKKAKIEKCWRKREIKIKKKERNKNKDNIKRY